MTDLKPCPFCGSKAEFAKASFSTDEDVVKCRQCNFWISGDAYISATTAWNTRPAESALRARVAELGGALREMVRLVEFRAKCSGSEGYMKSGADRARAALKGQFTND